MTTRRVVARRLHDGVTLRGPSIVEWDDGTITAVRDLPFPAATTTSPGVRTRDLPRDLSRHLDRLQVDADDEVDLVAPGLIDLQVNGYDDLDVAECDGDGLRRLDAALAVRGTTTYLATLTTAASTELDERLTRLDRAIAGKTDGGIGVHLEGPFLGSRHGAHPSPAVRVQDETFARWADGLPANVRLMTIGCESPATTSVVAALRRRGIVVAIGHTAPSEAQFVAALRAGASVVTHLFNAMSGVHHRDDGLALLALTTDEVVATLIADGAHVGARAVTMAFRTKQPGTIALVSDSVAWRGRWLLARGAALAPDGGVRLSDGVLAGASNTLADAVRRCVVDWGLGLGEALAAATSTPARTAGLTDRGVLAPGMRADLVAFDEHLDIVRAWVDGRPITG